MTDNGPIIVEPAPDDAEQRWRVVVGQEMLDFLASSVPEPARDNISEAAVSIISKGVPPTEEVGRRDRPRCRVRAKRQDHVLRGGRGTRARQWLSDCSRCYRLL